ncbi:hypothetical protein [Halobacterium sp. R2-5]|nr:hypothetical protein [Halobacterium sp. R2-5]NIC00697.1 hypothetical protein [Halobacterium sp. R2-5]
MSDTSVVVGGDERREHDRARGSDSPPFSPARDPALKGANVLDGTPDHA